MQMGRRRSEITDTVKLFEGLSSNELTLLATLFDETESLKSFVKDLSTNVVAKNA